MDIQISEYYLCVASMKFDLFRPSPENRISLAMTALWRLGQSGALIVSEKSDSSSSLMTFLAVSFGPLS